MKLQISLSAKPTQEQYIQQLIDSGLKSLGEGNYGTVFPHPTDSHFVIKVANADTADTECLAWLKWCQKNPNPYVPHIRSIERVASKKYFIAELEKLQPVTHTQVGEFIQESGLNKVLQISKNVPVRWDMHPQFIEELQDKTLRKLMKAMHKFSTLDPRRHGLDITAENVMRRGNQFVFTDPIV